MTSQFMPEKNFISLNFLIVSLINKPGSQNNPLSNLLVKIYHFDHRELLASKVLLI